MKQIQSPFQQFFDTSGDPLDSGYIYIGITNQNPETNPLQVYWDDALTIPAVQPIRTSNGYVVNNGNPARLYTNAEDFSLTVKDKRSNVVFAVLDATSLSNLQSQLASNSGASLVGFIQSGAGAVARTVSDKLHEVVSIRDFGAVGDGITDDTLAIQAAMNHAASIGLMLTSPAKSTYLISAGLSIPTGLIADFGFSTIKRKPGSVFNLLSNTGGTAIYLSNLFIDGNKSADSRVATNVGDRFGGLVLNSVTNSEIRNVQASGTVNAEDGRAGVYLNGCNRIDLYNVGGSDNDRSCVFINASSFCRLFGSYTSNNLGSGVTSENSNDCEYYDCFSVNSGYSGISINGKRNKGARLRATGTASGYAGVNIGHDDANNRADDSIIENIHSYDNLGWGVLVAGSSRVQLRGVYIKGNTNHNLQVGFNSSACTVSGLTSTGSGKSGAIFISGKGHKIVSGEIYGNAYYGIDIESGCSAAISADVRCYNNCTADNTLAGVLLNSAVDCTVDAECFDDQGTKTQGYGVWLAGGTGNMIGGYLHDLKTAPLRESSSPVYTSRNMRTGNHSMAGTFSPTVGQTTVTVTNNNARAGMLVIFYPINAAGRTLGTPTLGTITAGTSFVANMGGAASGSESYGYNII